jgi:hypothetical protein
MGTFMVLIMCIPFAIVLWTLRRLNEIVIGCCLGSMNKKYEVFADYVGSWLGRSWRLPFKMKANGSKHWWIGILLTLVSPIALFVYSAIPWVYHTYVPIEVSIEKAPYKTQADIVALTELEDFPSFSYSRGNVGTIDSNYSSYYFTFDKPLTAQYIEKLKAQCADIDNAFWTNQGDTCFVLHRAWDGEHIKSPIKNRDFEANLELSVDRNGFNITRGFVDYFPLEKERNPKHIIEETGVVFPQYILVDFVREFPTDIYKLRLDKKPSADFIREIEASAKWKKQDDSVYVFSNKSSESPSYARITVNKYSRIVKVEDRVMDD